MTIYSSPPPARSFYDDKPTLLVCWWCTLFSAVIIMFRVCGRYIRTEKLFKEDWLALACLIPLFCRMALVHVVLLFGTNNAIIEDFSERALYRRAIGSRLVLVSRIFYAATLWMLKLTISEFFKRLTINIWTRSHERTLIFIRWFLLVTFIAVIIADISECQPINHYWQVTPDPGAKCRQGYAQLLTMGTVNVLTDLLLVLFPVPIIIGSTMRIKRKIQLVLLFAGSLIPAGITLYRIPEIIDRHGLQQYRSLLASVEILFATAVANALILGSFVRDRGVKKQKWKFGSITDTLDRTTSRRGTAARQWGSDEDLVRGLGLGVNPELRGVFESPPRPAPMAVAGNMPVRSQRFDSVGESDWRFPSDTSDEIDFVKSPPRHESEDLTSMMSPRRVSFFDVGGLLDQESPRRVSSTRTMDTEYTGESSTQGGGPVSTTWSFENGLSPAPPRRGSIALLQDIGGLLGPRTRIQRNSNTTYELETILRDRVPPTSHPSLPHSHSMPPPIDHLARQQDNLNLQDVGGLLGR
ncbi:0b4c2b96-10df-4c75-9af0-f0e6b9c6a80a [Sclerotinia trifoliorum]|uniref:0b4c2b96-10df-4c75-9af0-f0e6b9c6a80a n=1 Tax=Sclerotinia trifoliorum TaxID=28548 RepID=A0A8H2VXF0_9HELO|nr:0b4c2b96-10df-4c75-9af0-f0e6b9c6a80a [Sclerotinia trifoliorum]